MLPAVDRAAAVTETPLGRLTVPAQVLPERRVTVDLTTLLALRDAARSAAANAHAPYSRFTVGAAAIMADDPQRRMIIGANVENATYGATICAERTALAQAAALGFRRVELLAVSCTQALDAPLADRSPCGICRQTIAEFASDDPPTLVLVDGGGADAIGDLLDIDRLLPHGFRLR
ncbi:MAG: cytidine deaminase [Alphaproteobacteria bacterium]|nr:cytidine deaminase [Alphaproteobacteria bacterium]